MPTYDYQCQNCDHALEIFQKINDPLLKKCPVCHQETLQRGIGGGTSILRFIGEGFYVNESKCQTEKKCGSGGDCQGSCHD
ncbi:MAG: zinc ribbon domain-containing protein [Chlamydiales bacterium]